ncbi:hypothetical protein O0I10_004920 [Lichtheimia ornata]|uniref:Uncharacterized protein n=1 Tax=Lichtheimia ornata TaxID=688661 RepID=A0AAD7V644_9FUNG|nr:uncharacterized protein O0I10_004920 [Lichtheimia ornata]KAJ8659206.1 hypothetical protein O0I10_004920 [Lichtheimia ornata]
MSKQMSSAILLFYCLLRLVSGFYVPSSSRDLVGDTAHYHHRHHHHRRHDLTTSDDDSTAIFGTWYMVGASPNMQNMMVNSNLSAMQGMACGCAYMDLAADEGTMDAAANDQCNNMVDVKTYCDLTSSNGNPSATGQIATIGSAIPENTTNATSSGQEITLEYTIDTLILSLGNWSQAPAMNQSIPVNYTMEIHSKLLNASSSCDDSNGGSSCDGGLLSWTDLDSQRYTALYTHEATVNQSMFDDLVKQAGDQGKDLVHLNTTCASSNSTIHNM